MVPIKFALHTNFYRNSFARFLGMPPLIARLYIQPLGAKKAFLSSQFILLLACIIFGRLYFWNYGLSDNFVN